MPAPAAGPWESVEKCRSAEAIVFDEHVNRRFELAGGDSGELPAPRLVSAWPGNLAAAASRTPPDGPFGFTLRRNSQPNWLASGFARRSRGRYGPQVQRSRGQIPVAIPRSAIACGLNPAAALL